MGIEPQIFWLWSLLNPIHLSQHPLNHNALYSLLVKAQCTHEFILSINFCRVFTLPSGPTLVCTARSFMTLKSVKTSSDRPATQNTRPIKQITAHHDLAIPKQVAWRSRNIVSLSAVIHKLMLCIQESCMCPQFLKLSPMSSISLDYYVF